MKKFLDFVEENVFSIFITLALLALLVGVIIVEFKIASSDLYDLEENCFNFYKDNNYVLDECNKYSDKLRGN